MKKLSVIIGMLVMIVAGCGKIVTPDSLISTPGTYNLKDAYLTAIIVEENSNGALRLKFVRREPEGTSSPRRDLKEGWFVFIESENNIWVYYGGDGDIRHNVEYNTFSKQTSTCRDLSSPNNLPGIPNAVLEKLPVTQRDKLMLNKEK